MNIQGMKEKCVQDISKRLKLVFKNKDYVSKLSLTDTNWLGMDVKLAINRIESLLEKMICRAVGENEYNN